MQTRPGEPLTLASKADLASAPALHAALAAAEGDVVVDASQVAVLTTPVAQILVAAGDALRAQGGSLSLSAPTDSASLCLAELGLSRDRIERGAPPAGGDA